MACRHWQQSLAIGPSVRVWANSGRARTLTAGQHGLRCLGVINGRLTSVRRSSARVTGFYARNVIICEYFKAQQ